MIDPKPEKRIVDGSAQPLDSKPVEENFCPLCHIFTVRLQRCHLVGKGAGGDDVPENLLWACSSCHTRLHNGRPETCAQLVTYVRWSVPELGDYADRKKYPGYVERRYLLRALA